jgi:chromosome segregation ATPase
MKIKNLLIVGILAFFITSNLIAQDDVRLIESTDEAEKEVKKTNKEVKSFEAVNTELEIFEERKVMFLGAKNALVTDLPADPKFVEKSWKEFMNKYGKTKKVKKSKEMGTEGISIMSIGGTTPVSVYALPVKGSAGTEMATWIKMGDDFVSSDNPDIYDASLALMNEFSIKLNKDIVAVELEEEEKDLKKMLSELKKLKKDNENYHKEIEKAKARIMKMEANIEENVKDQEMTTAKIEDQESNVDMVRKKLNGIGN